MNNIITGVLDTDNRFVSEIVQDSISRAQIKVSPLAGELSSEWFPLVRESDRPHKPQLFLDVWYTVEIDLEGNYLQVYSSGFGLFAKVKTRKRPRPIIRVEYDRIKETLGSAAAHFHLHANSPELAWVYGWNRQHAPDLHDLHFPAGGRHFRPSLEDFLFFLEREKIFNNWKEGWRSTLSDSLRTWNRSQAAATVRRNQEVAVETLEKLGYTVTKTPSDSDRS